MKCITDAKPNGNVAGTCTRLHPGNIYCNQAFTVDQFYNKTTGIVTPTGPCSGTIYSTGISGLKTAAITGGNHYKFFLYEHFTSYRIFN